MNEKYQKTIYACFVGYIVQAIINNFVPLLFLTFESTYQIPLSRITILITFNFGVQLMVDLLSAGFVDRIGYRVSIMLAHIFAAAGLLAGDALVSYEHDAAASAAVDDLAASAGLAVATRRAWGDTVIDLLRPDGARTEGAEPPATPHEEETR